MRARLVAAAVLTLAVSSVDAQRAPAPDITDLPVRRVVLYKSGVGFFEHVGSIAGNASVAIQFTTAQLNPVRAGGDPDLRDSRKPRATKTFTGDQEFRRSRGIHAAFRNS